MSKIPKNIALAKLAEEDIWSDEWEDYVHNIQQNDWADYDEHPWAWYMERDQRKREGWYHVCVNPIHKNVTVIYWLKSQNAIFKNSRNEFLIKDSQIAMMATLQYA